MNNQIPLLAQFLGILPDEIIEFKQRDQLVNVINSQMQKFSVPATVLEQRAPAPVILEDGEQLADNLTRISGIGVATQERLNESGVLTFADLAKSDTRDLAEKLSIAESKINRWKVNSHMLDKA